VKGSHRSRRFAAARKEAGTISRLVEETMKTCVHEVMTKGPITIDPEASLETAAAVMREREVRHLPVVDEGGRLVSIITDRDLRGPPWCPPWPSTCRALPSDGFRASVSP
jgi:CBS-domain-containing membrane protein